jgi:hypothetical protein
MENRSSNVQHEGKETSAEVTGNREMPYSVLLTRKGSRTVRANFKMYDAPTPSRGDIIVVDATVRG